MNWVAADAWAQNGDAKPQMSKDKLFELMKNWSFGYENYKNKQFERAAKYFWIVTKLDSIDKFPKVYRYLGDSYFKLENPDSAQIVFEIGSSKYPKDAHLHRMIGFLKSQREQTEEAITEYETVVGLEPDSKDDWKQLALLYAKADRDEDSISAYDKVLEFDPNDLEAKNNQSALYARTGDTSGLIAKKEEIRTADTTNSQVRYELGEIYYREQEYDKAISVFREFLALTPNDIGVMEYVAISLKSLDKLSESIAEYKKILSVQPDNKKVLAEISRNYKDINRFQNARTYANKALAVDRQYGLGWIALGEAYEASAEKCVSAKDGSVDFSDKLVYELARQQYRRGAQSDEFHEEAQRHIGYLQGALPTKEDVFMHRQEKRPKTDCFAWIPDGAFGDAFHKILSRRLK